MKISKVIIALALIVWGALWLASNYDILDMSWIYHIHFRKFLVPAIIILIGFKVLSNALDGRGKKKGENLEEIPASNECEVIFCGRSMNFNGQTFDGVRVKAFMGGAKIDLRGADIVDGSVLYVNTLFGGVEIKVPSDIAVDIKSNSFMGGVNDERKSITPSLNKKIVIEASCMLGGVNIKN